MGGLRAAFRRSGELFASGVFALAAIASIAVLALIFLFLFSEGLPAFRFVSPGRFLLGRDWYPTSEPPSFGLLPLLAGSAWVTAGTLAISVPLGLAVAVYIGEVAPRAIRELLKPVLELLAAVPSVVFGFIGIALVAPAVKSAFGLPSGFTLLAGAIVLSAMALPTIVSLSEDALRSVPESYRHASLALGATEWETVIHATLPAARRGMVAAVMLAMGRVVGETMTVLMITGNAAVVPRSALGPGRTMTATIAAEMGEAVRFSPHYSALFAVGIALFLITFAVNLAADVVLRRGER